MVYARLSPDATVLSVWSALESVWSALEGLVPEHCDSSWCPPQDRDALQAARTLDCQAGAKGVAAVQAWWQARQDNAYVALLRVDQSKLYGLSLAA